MTPARQRPVRLNLRALNRALLARQLLLERRALPVAEALEHLVGMQAQEPQAPYLGMFSRLEGFAPEALSELIAARRAVRASLMRCTIHLVTAADWVRLWPAMSPVLARGFSASPFSKAVAGVDLDELLLLGRRLLGEGPRTRAELGPLLAQRWPGVDAGSLAYAVSYLTPVVQVPPRGLWRQTGAARWTAAELWLGWKLYGGSTADALIPRYLAAFGPATVADIQAWSGMTGLAAAVARQRERLRSFEDEQGRELLDLPGAPLPDPDTPAPPRFLAPFDNAILSHADRSRIVATEDRAAVNGERLMRTFLVDGFVAGTWRLEGATIHISPIRRLAKKDLSALRGEAHRLLAFVLPDAAKTEVRVGDPA